MTVIVIITFVFYKAPRMNGQNSSLMNRSLTREESLEQERQYSKRAKKIACTECRQQKAKCDAFKMQPNPCSRCQKRGVPCKLVSDFKRTFKRAKMEQIVKEYEHIKSKIPSDNNDNNDLLFNPSVVSSPSNLPFLPPLQKTNSSSNFYTRSNTPPIQPNVNSLLSLLGGVNTIPRSNTPPLLTQVNTELPRNESFYSTNHVAMNNLITAAHSSTSHPPIESTTNEPSVFKTAEYKFYKPESIPKPIITEEMLICQSKSLGEVFLSTEQIVVLFKIFLEFYHPFFPVVDISKGIERIYRLSPVLFWTIMFISLRRHHSYDACITKKIQQELYFKVSATLKSVLAEITISPITRYAPTETEDPILNVSSVYSVQAFLLYTFWPPLISSLSADSSWNTIGIAFYQAIRMGLHSRSRDASADRGLLNEQIKTWIACNVVSQTIATAFGFPGFVQSHVSLLTICKDEGYDIPFQLTQMLEVQLFEDQIARTLNNNIFDSSLLADASEKLPLIQLLSNELDQLEMRLCSNDNCHMDDFRNCVLLASRVHLFSYHFLDTSRIAKFELQKGIIKVYNASVSFLSHVQNSNLRDPYFVANLPSVYNLIIWQVSVIIARLIHSPYKEFLDIGAGKSQYQIAMRMTSTASIIKHDIAYRSAGIMKSTWMLFKKLNDEGANWPKVSVTSRMSVSVFFDSLMILREKCGMSKLGIKDGSNGDLEHSDGSNDVDDDVDDEEEDGDDDDEDEQQQELISATVDKPSSINGNGNETLINNSRSDSSNSAIKKRNNYHLESAARKIISTIPLDPQPIAISVSPSNGSSPSSGKSTTSPQGIVELRKMATSPGTKIGKSPLAIHKPTTTGSTTPKDNKTESPGKELLDGWELAQDFDTEMLFKDLDTVMNDFGFHGDF